MSRKLYAITFPETGPMRVRFSRWWIQAWWFGILGGLETFARRQPARMTTVYLRPFALTAAEQDEVVAEIRRDPEGFRRHVCEAFDAAQVDAKA